MINVTENGITYEVYKDVHSGTSWYLNKLLHREGGPAVERINGDKHWYLNDHRHRENGPAIEYANGDKSYYLNGKLDRIDGPAVELANGYKYYYLDDVLYTEDEFNQEITKRNQEVMRETRINEVIIDRFAQLLDNE
jgi:hypothetical protein